MEGDGDLNAEILFVIESPSGTDDSVSRLAWGKTGQLLREGLKDVGIEVYRIEALVRCRIPAGRKPSAKEVDACRPYFDWVVEHMPNLKVIVAVGAVAMRVFAKKSGINKWAGTPLPSTVAGVTVYTVFSPGSLYHNPELADRYLAQLAGITTLLTGVDENFTKLYRGAEAIDQIERFANYSTPVAFDFETTGFDPAMHSFLDVSFYGGRGKPVSCRLDDPDALDWLAYFCNSDVPKIVHHLPMEYRWSLFGLGVELENVIADTRLLAYRENCNRPTNLGTVSATFVPEVNGFKVDSQSALEQGERWWELDETIRATRNAVDAYATYVVWKKLSKKLRPDIIKVHQELDIPIAKMVSRMQQRGMALSVDQVLVMENEQTKIISSALKEAKKVGITASLTSPQQLEANFKELRSEDVG